MHKWDKTFWMLFVLLESAIILGNLWYFSPIAVILGFSLIAVALARFGDYLMHKENKDLVVKNSDNIERLKRWLGNQYELTQGIKDLHNYRFHRMENKKVVLSEKMDQNYRELAGKIIDVENKLNLLSRSVVSQKNLMSPFPETVTEAADITKDFFEDVWSKIISMAEKEGHIRTLSRGVRNKILDIGNNGIKLRSDMTKKERFIDKKEFRYFWELLQEKGRIDLKNDVEDPRLLRIGSVVISFLARLPNVEHSLKPRILYLMEKETHNLGTLKRRRKNI